MTKKTGKGVEVRVRTWIGEAEDGSGWFCVVGFWDPGSDFDGEPSSSMQVGPFESEAIARAELKGDFRTLVNRGIQDFAAKNGGFTRDARQKLPEA